MKDRIVAQRYAKAFLEIFRESNFDSLLNDISALRKVFTDSGELIKKIDSYLLSPQKREELINLLSENLQNRKVWRNLFGILVEKHRFSIIEAILYELEAIIYEKRNQIKVILKTAHKHSPTVIENIRKKVSEIFNKDVIFDARIEPEIIGGFVAETESFRIDGSIRNNLIKFKNIIDKMRVK
ncbi:MAG: ATP synthase F1 subunit delta [Candidatus Cloacimonas sp. 4484_275]|nr:MAG: ATP synthase F1 subunit delta [Candidatus Cloacimonas sp. 4484_275]RLC52174.1 MAG: ATP synthase F1 subunit delta [Candidatus Cloacimonadota bacterium]